MATVPARPTPAELAAARGRSIPDTIAPGLEVLFVGINPSLWSGAVGRHFARPGNRFWPGSPSACSIPLKAMRSCAGGSA
jgi:TDG/mug DNA glycosylase family protein